MTTRRRFLSIASASASAALLDGCLRPSTLPVPASTLPPSSETTGEHSLKFHGAQHQLLFGTAVDVRSLRDPAYAALVASQANIVVAENAMKWNNLRPTSATYDFEGADQIVAFAESHHMKIRGHNLAWHRQLPQWFAAEATPANAKDLLTSHIERVMGRYSGRMHSWDVVNEAIEIKDGRPDGLRNSAWMNLLGPDYIEIAFRTARNADPQALLTYNDYGIECETPGNQQKRQALLTMLRRMKARNVPIDAVGIQSHVEPPDVFGEGLLHFLAEVRGMGLQVFLTEMDVNDRKLPGDIARRDQGVAETYSRYLDLTLSDPSVHALLTWGLSDRHTWLNSEGARPDHEQERCLPFDRELAPKSAFFAIRNSIDRRAAL